MRATAISHWWNRCWGLRRRGILGLNRRDADYVLLCNRRAYYPYVDNKLLTKRICAERRIRVPETYAVISRHGDAQAVLERIRHRRRFVVKPATGSGGRGILMINGRNGLEFEGSGGTHIPLDELKYHILTILSGMYSLGGKPDRAVIEQRLVGHPVLDRLAAGGIPDVRIILYRGVPAMAMIRLPTSASRGRANLHQGAVAAGVDLATGATLGGAWRNRAVAAHPDTDEPLAGLRVPDWPEVLEGAVKLGDGLQLGYIGIDYVIDANAGPVVLEANARPGLAVQIANRRGLLSRSRFIDTQQPELLTPRQRLDLTAQLGAID